MHRLVTAADGQQIAARFFSPTGEAKGAVLVVPAMGVSQDYYEPFARWLAQQGFTAATSITAAPGARSRASCAGSRPTSSTGRGSTARR